MVDRVINNFYLKYTHKQIFLFLSVFTLIKNGMWIIPNSQMTLSLAENPFVNPFDDSILIWSWLELLILFFLRIDTILELATFRFITLVFAYLVIYRILLKVNSEENLKKSIVLFFIFPITSVMTYWLSYDSLTLLLIGLIILFSRHNLLIFFFSILLGLQHFEIGIITFSLLILFNFIEKLKLNINLFQKSAIFFVLIGIATGKLLLNQLFSFFNISYESVRGVQLGFISLTPLIQTFANLHLVIWSFFGIGWLVIISYITHKKNTKTLSLIFFLTFSTTLFVTDQTRIFTLITFALVLTNIILNQDFLATLSNKFLGLLLIAWILIPTVYVWEGIARGSNIFFNLFILFDLVFQWNLSEPINLPFDFRYSFIP